MVGGGGAKWICMSNGSCRCLVDSPWGIFWAYSYVVHIPYSAEVLSSLIALQLRGEGLGFAL